jgi:hypothetical protein
LSTLTTAGLTGALLMLIVIPIALIKIYVENPRTRRSLRAALAAAGFDPQTAEDDKTNPAIIFQSGGRRFKLSYFFGGRGAPNVFSVGALVASDASFEAVRRDRASVLSDAAGFFNALRTEDARFEADFAVSSDAPAMASYLADEEKRLLIRRLFDQDCARLKLSSGQFTAYWRGIGLGRPALAAALAESVAALEILARGL